MRVQQSSSLRFDAIESEFEDLVADLWNPAYPTHATATTRKLRKSPRPTQAHSIAPARSFATVARTLLKDKRFRHGSRKTS
jgi:hypothetical protein